MTVSDFNPVAHWTCDEEGGVRYDSTANDYDLTDTNTVLYTTGLRGNACDFEATNSEYLSISNTPLVPTGSSSRSITGWINLESLNTAYGYNVVLDYGTDSVNQEFNLLHSTQGTGATTDDRFFMDKYSSGVQGDLQALSLATWYFTAITYNGTTIRWYLNGTQVGSTSAGTINTASGDVSIGRRGAGAQNVGFFDGLIDEVSVFSTALSSSDITQLYNGGAPLAYSATPTSSASSTATTTIDVTDTNFLLVILIFFVSFIFLGVAFSPLNRK